MNRRKFLHNTSLFAGSALLFQKTSFASFFNINEFKLKMLRNDVGIFTERGGTIGFYLSKDGPVIVDSQFPDTVVHLIDEINKQSQMPIQILLNTHHHADHSSGNFAFKDIAKQVVAHANSLANQKAVAEKQKTTEKQLFPNQTFDKELKLKTGDEKIMGYYFGAAHTNGDAVYHFENANIMHLGDLMFNKRHPRVDRTTGANIQNWIKVLDKIQKKGNKNTIYIFGHSLTAGEETGTAEDLKKFQDYLGKVIQFAETEFKKGVPKEEFIKNASVPGVTEWTGNGLELTLTAAYEEASEANKKA
jgi:cyclase